MTFFANVPKEELKTLKDISLKGAERRDVVGRRLVDYDELKAEAIKWMKEDIEDDAIITTDMLTDRWMKRLDITEDDLK